MAWLGTAGISRARKFAPRPRDFLTCPRVEAASCLLAMLLFPASPDASFFRSGQATARITRVFMGLVIFTHKGKVVKRPQQRGDCLTFFSSRPAIIQPSEIMKVHTDLQVEVPEGFVLSLSSAPELASRAGEIFPGHLVLTATDGRHPLELSVRNGGRSPLNIMPEQVIAVGTLLQAQPFEPEFEELENALPAGRPKSAPQKKNPDIQFELKGFTNGRS
jgi:hypothetical protein